MIRHTPLLRKRPVAKKASTLRRTHLKPVSAKRKREAKEYAKLRAEFLANRPICEVWLKENGWTQIKFAGPWESCYQRNSTTTPGKVNIVGPDYLLTEGAPQSRDLHHAAKRGRNYLNVATWMAVSRKNHERIEGNRKWARQMGFLK
jgi:hypothetical protein